MSPSIYFRVDGNNEIGLGHIVRCIALADMLKVLFDVSFFCQHAPKASIYDIESSGFSFNYIETEDLFLKKLKPDDIVVLDGYHFNTNYQRKIKDIGCILVCIDDLHNQEFAADLIINHSPGISPLNYNAPTCLQFSLGLDYVLLRPAFLKHAKKQRSIEKIEIGLICFGGSDFKNLTKRILETLTTYNQFKKINVITGNSYSQFDSLNKIIINDDRIKHYHSVNEQQMLDLMCESDLAVVPASGVLFEALAVGVKVISGCYVENQYLVFENLKRMKAFESADNFEDEKFKIAINNILKSIQSNNLKIIDGNSGKRHLSTFIKLKSKIRSAEFKDCQMIFEWANDSEVRKNAISKKSIEWADHVNWFKAKLSTDKARIYILEFNGKPIGQIRYEKHETFWIVSYSVISSFRGLGFGKILLSDTLSLFEGDYIRAIVQEDNIASQKVFRSLNFVKKFSEMKEGNIFFTYEYLK